MQMLIPDSNIYRIPIRANLGLRQISAFCGRLKGFCFRLRSHKKDEVRIEQETFREEVTHQSVDAFLGLLIFVLFMVNCSLKMERNLQ